MAEIKSGEGFGIDSKVVSKVDWSLALKRVLSDSRTDFIYAPHLGLIYRNAGPELIAQLTSELKAGAFNPGVPITIEVPKSFRMRVAVTPTRLGPSFSRPGSILLPRDRLLYQALADQAAPIIEAKSDAKRSFSHRLALADSANMFQPTRVCWGNLQKALAKHSKSPKVRYILKIDVSNFFGSINQHTMINVLNDAGYSKSMSSRLEVLLTSFTGERSSRGILQGMYPSDLMGNFYMEGIDRFLEDYGVLSARYVDDMYIFVDSVDSADALLRNLIPALRSYDLVLNEAKSVVMPKSALVTEEPDLEALFADAVEEISEQVDESSFDADYGFQSEWDENTTEDDDGDDLELKATKILFDSIADYPGHEENIERFCLPLFSKALSNYAVAHVVDSFKKRPSMSQIYGSYLAKFLDDPKIYSSLVSYLRDDTLADWQRMWVLAALLQKAPIDNDAMKSALSLLKDANLHESLRAVAAIYVGRYGDYTRRKTLVSVYANVSNYIKAAIYYSSNTWPSVERSNAKASWGGHGELNSLLTIAMSKKPVPPAHS